MSMAVEVKEAEDPNFYPQSKIQLEVMKHKVKQAGFSYLLKRGKQAVPLECSSACNPSARRLVFVSLSGPTEHRFRSLFGKSPKDRNDK